MIPMTNGTDYGKYWPNKFLNNWLKFSNIIETIFYSLSKSVEINARF